MTSLSLKKQKCLPTPPTPRGLIDKDSSLSDLEKKCNADNFRLNLKDIFVLILSRFAFGGFCTLVHLEVLNLSSCDLTP